jgi:hypothetical protein
MRRMKLWTERSRNVRCWRMADSDKVPARSLKQGSKRQILTISFRKSHANQTMSGVGDGR